MALDAVISGNLTASPPLVLLHGFGGGAYIWKAVMAQLDGVCPVIAYDLPGHGGSIGDAGTGGAGRMAKSVIADLDRRGVETFLVAGHSMGGALAAILCLRHPERVVAASLLAPGGIGASIHHRALRDFAKAQTTDEMRQAMVAMAGPHAPVSPEAVEHALASHRLPGGREALTTVLDAILTRSADEIVQGRLPMDEIATLPMPVQVMWGDQDGILPFAQSANLPGNVVLKRIVGAGHMLVDECPVEVSNLLRDMVSRGRIPRSSISVRD